MGCKEFSSSCKYSGLKSFSLIGARYDIVSIEGSSRSLIVEVLSPSIEAYDRGKKFKLYQRSIALTEHVLVSAEEIEIEVFRKNDRDKWEVTNCVSGDVVELESINLTFTSDQVYRGIEL
jgi:Uma2 family endonuclease